MLNLELPYCENNDILVSVFGRKGIVNVMSVRTALIYEGHLAPIVEADGYFDAIIPFRTLLGI